MGTGTAPHRRDSGLPQSMDAHRKMDTQRHFEGSVRPAKFFQGNELPPVFFCLHGPLVSRQAAQGEACHRRQFSRAQFEFAHGPRALPHSSTPGPKISGAIRKCGSISSVLRSCSHESSYRCAKNKNPPVISIEEPGGRADRARERFHLLLGFRGKAGSSAARERGHTTKRARNVVPIEFPVPAGIPARADSQSPGKRMEHERQRTACRFRGIRIPIAAQAASPLLIRSFPRLPYRSNTPYQPRVL